MGAGKYARTHFYIYNKKSPRSFELRPNHNPIKNQTQTHLFLVPEYDHIIKHIYQHRFGFVYIACQYSFAQLIHYFLLY